MADIKTSDVYYRFNNRMVALARSGISWGTNNYPTNSLYSWFGGSTSGWYGLPSFAALEGPAKLLDADTLRATLHNYLLIYSRIRRTRIYIRRTRSNYGDNTPTVIYDTIAIANLPAADQLAIPVQVAGSVNEGFSIDQSETYDFIERLRNAYNTYSRVSTLKTLSRDVCHSQCHDNCHNSRGRR